MILYIILLLIILVIIIWGGATGWKFIKGGQQEKYSGKKIAFCFLIYDKINHEELWDQFFKNVDKNKYNIYVHYKWDNPLKFFEKYKLKNSIETKYADTSLIHAMNLLIKKSYDDGCYKIIILSQSCIPIKSFNYIYSFLTKNDKSYFNITDKNIFPRCNPVLKYYSKELIKKSSNWFILNRKIVNMVLSKSKNEIDNIWNNVVSPEEHYYITEVYNNNLNSEIITTQNLGIGATTFTNWSDIDYKFKDSLESYPKGRPKNYTSISEEELKYLLNSNSLFARKFDTKCRNSLNKKIYIDSIIKKII